ncbi:alpha/beta fold hydrolase [candidate division GN15 bacterium]|nr:alpha/beta fold hydrolase [candidate division GN15 bacterium]
MRLQESLTVPGGKLVYAEYGDLAGKPILYCHGWPGSRLQARLTDEPAASLGLHIIAPDRPGMGRSTCIDDRRVLDWPDHVSHLLDHLGVDSFGVLGVSGGAPYALACASALPDRVSMIQICSGVPRHDWLHRSENPALRYRFARFLTSTSTVNRGALLSLFKGFIRTTPASLFVRTARLVLPSCDQRALRDRAVRAAVLQSMREAFQGPVRGLSRDLVLLTSPWGFEFSEIAAKVRYWHGGSDYLCPMEQIEATVNELPNATLKRLPDLGHYSLPVAMRGEILRALSDS